VDYATFRSLLPRPEMGRDEWEWAATDGALAAKSAAVSIDWLLNYPIQLEQA